MQELDIPVEKLKIPTDDDEDNLLFNTIIRTLGGDFQFDLPDENNESEMSALSAKVFLERKWPR